MRNAESKTPFFCFKPPFVFVFNGAHYQDRLGTNIGKALKITTIGRLSVWLVSLART
eukprot:COSAG06_NODE_17946_length_906_cov_8.413284_1_plen_56_part_01